MIKYKRARKASRRDWMVEENKRLLGAPERRGYYEDLVGIINAGRTMMRWVRMGVD